MAALATKLSLSLCSTMSAVAVSSKVKGKSKANYYGRSMSALEARVSLLFALASQSQRVVTDLVAKSVAPMSRNLEEALMAAETTMPGREGFDFFGASQSFNLLAEYLFGKNMPNEKIEMTTPVITRRTTNGDKMEMTTPVITRKAGNQEKWKMSFVMPSKYGSNLPVPKDSAVRITKVPKKIVAVAAFSGFVTEEDVKQRESKLRKALKNNLDFKVKVGAEVEIAQYNPPFALPFTRRNEIALEVERKKMND